MINERVMGACLGTVIGLESCTWGLDQCNSQESVVYAGLPIYQRWAGIKPHD